MTEFFSKTAFRSVRWILFNKIVGFILYFLISVVIVRHLTPEDYGRYSLTRTFAETLLLFCTLGLNQAASRFIPELMVKENGRGLRKFLVNTFFMRLAGFITMALVLIASFDWIDDRFDLRYPYALPLILALTLGMNFKEYVNFSFTALYKAKSLAIFSIGQAFLWLGLLGIAIGIGLGLTSVVISQAASLLLYLVAVFLLARHVRQIHIGKGDQGINTKRILKIATPIFINALMMRFVMGYTEIFFLGYYKDPTIVSYYSLGFYLPQLIITFIPWAIQSLFTAAFAEAYTRDSSSLPSLTRGMFQILMVVVLPIGAFGALFAPNMIPLIYGSKMAAAGPVAAAFFLIQLLPCCSIPWSMGITAREQVHQTIWLLVLQLSLNVLLDYLLIPTYGIPGAITAVAATFALTFPIRLLLVRHILDGLYFPLSFLIRIGGCCSIAAFITHLFLPGDTVLTLALALPVFAFALIALTRGLRLIRPSDTKEFRAIGLDKLNWLIDWMTG